MWYRPSRCSHCSPISYTHSSIERNTVVRNNIRGRCQFIKLKGNCHRTTNRTDDNLTTSADMSTMEPDLDLLSNNERIRLTTRHFFNEQTSLRWISFGQDLTMLLQVCLTSCCGPLGRHSLISWQLHAASRLRSATYIGKHSGANQIATHLIRLCSGPARCCSQPASQLL